MFNLSFQMFQASRYWCADLREILPDAYEDISQGVPCGFVYDGDCLIEHTPSGFLLVIHNEQWTWANLTALESVLYEWCLDEFGGVP